MIDADTAIAFLNCTSLKLVERVKRVHPADLVLSSVVMAELYFGVEASAHRAENMERLVMFRARVGVVSFDEAAAQHFGQIHADLTRRGIRIGPMDTLIGAHARSLGLCIVTANTREFRRIRELKVENWLK